MLNITFLRKTLSRPRDFTATHGITSDKRDYLSITKNQGTEGLCWAYALTSTFEMSYALKSGNRLMLNPNFTYEHAVPWWKEQKKSMRKQYEPCLSYGEDKGYLPFCATMYLIGSGDSITQMDGDDSFLTITYAETLKINSLPDLNNALDTYGVLYVALDADPLQSNTIISKYIPSETSNHAVVMTAIGEIKGYDGVYVEILNSWGYNHGYDGLQYIKIADSNVSCVVNNMNILSDIIGIQVERNPFKQYADLFWALGLGITLIITLIVLTVISILYYRLKKTIAPSTMVADQSDNLQNLDGTASYSSI